MSVDTNSNLATFDQALTHLRCGLPARRDNWSGNVFLQHKHGAVETIIVVGGRHENAWVFWSPCIDDIVARNWVLIHNKLGDHLDSIKAR